MARSSRAPTARTAPQAAFAARAFASEAADLAVRIDPQQPVESIDALLAGCLRSVGDAPLAAASQQRLRNWSVARRLDALIAIRLAGGVATEPIPLRCPRCGEPFEIGLDLAACRPAETPERIDFEVDGRRFEARCPTGDDHARWQAERPSLRLVAGDLLDTRTEPDDAVVAGLDAALARHDPARELPVSTACPACAHAVETSVNLETQLLHAFAAEQRAWLREIAAVARNYPWSEADIAAMPAWRRRFYLARADDLGSAR